MDGEPTSVDYETYKYIRDARRKKYIEPVEDEKYLKDREALRISIKNILKDKKNWKIYYEEFAEQYLRSDWVYTRERLLKLYEKWQYAKKEKWLDQKDTIKKRYVIENKEKFRGADGVLIRETIDKTSNDGSIGPRRVRVEELISDDVIKTRSKHSRMLYDEAMEETYAELAGKLYNFDSFKGFIYKQLEKPPRNANLSDAYVLVEETLNALKLEEKRRRIWRRRRDKILKLGRQQIDEREELSLYQLSLYQAIQEDHRRITSNKQEYNDTVAINRNMGTVAEKFAHAFFLHFYGYYLDVPETLTPTSFLRLKGLLEWVKKYKKDQSFITLNKFIDNFTTMYYIRSMTTLRTALNNLIAYIEEYQARNKAKSVLGVWKSAKKLKF